ncbi:MAG: U32 family peptidase, partial [Halioglobus sp.]|nr:U32 family peptidase [Halioglobus sp.]
KRRPLRLEDWLAIGENLVKAGKDVVLSSLTLLEAASEVGSVRRICRNDRFLVEANDMAAVNIVSKLGLPFVAGPTLNIYNPLTLSLLAKQGLCRWVPPLEMSSDALARMQEEAPPGCECEVFAWGRLPLAWSARCYTARAENRPKDQCELACLADPDGRLIYTREDKPFLVLNGIQTQSALTQNLAHYLGELCDLGVDAIRLSPQSTDMAQIVACFHTLIHDRGERQALAKLDGLATIASCDGYWRGDAGFARPLEASQG